MPEAADHQVIVNGHAGCGAGLRDLEGISRLSIVAARCDIGVLLLVAVG